MAWLPTEPVCELYSHSDAELALTFVDELVREMTDQDMPPEVRSLGRTLATADRRLTHRLRE